MEYGQILEASAEDGSQHLEKCLMVGDCLERLLATLSPREAAIIRSLYGMHSGGGLGRKQKDVRFFPYSSGLVAGKGAIRATTRPGCLFLVCGGREL